MAYSNYKPKNWKTPTPSAASGSKRPQSGIDGNQNRVTKQAVIKTKHDKGTTKQVGAVASGTSQAMKVVTKQKDNAVKKAPIHGGLSPAAVISVIKKKKSTKGNYSYYTKGPGLGAKKGTPARSSGATSSFGVNPVAKSTGKGRPKSRSKGSFGVNPK